MSYSLYHYFEEAIYNFTKDKKNKINFSKDYEKVLSLAYVVWYTKNGGFTFDCLLKNAIEKITTNDDIKDFVTNALIEYSDYDFSYFEDVGNNHLVEVENYITQFIDPNSISRFRDEYITIPDYMVKLAIELLNIKNDDTVANFCSATGIFLHILEENYKYNLQKAYGYELDEKIYIISLMIKDVKREQYEIVKQDVLSNTFNTSFTKIFSDVPYTDRVPLNEDFKKLAHKFGEDDKRLVSSAKLFIQKIIDSLTDNGKALVIMPTSFLQSYEYKSFRHYLLKNNYLSCVIQCGFQLIPNTGISVTLLMLSKVNTELKLIDASNVYTTQRIMNVFSENDIAKIVSAYTSTKNTDISKIISYQELKGKEDDFDYLPYSHVTNNPSKHEGYTPLEELCMVKRGVSFSTEGLKEYTANTEGEEFYYLSQKDMQDGKILYDNLEKLTLPKDETNFKKTKDGNLVCKHLTLQDNDIVFCCLNTEPLNIAMVHCNEDIKIIPSCNLYVIRVNDNLKDKVSPYFIKANLENEKTYEFIAANTTSFKILQKTVQQVLIHTDLSDDKVEEIVNNYKSTQEHIADLQKELARCRGELKDIVESI